MRGEDVFPFCMLCWFGLDFKSDLSLYIYICRYILDFYALLWVALDRQRGQTSRHSFFSFARALSSSQNRRDLSLLVSV